MYIKKNIYIYINLRLAPVMISTRKNNVEFSRGAALLQDGRDRTTIYLQAR